jgi:hypothetical protein
MRARPLLTVYTSTQMRFRLHGTIAYRPFLVIVVMIAMNGTSRRVKRSGMDLAIECIVTIDATSGVPFWSLIWSSGSRACEKKWIGGSA